MHSLLVKCIFASFYCIVLFSVISAFQLLHNSCVECFNLTAVYPDCGVSPLCVEFSGAPWGIMVTDIGKLVESVNFRG